MREAEAPGQTRMRRTPEACGLPGLTSSDSLARLAWLGLPTGALNRRPQYKSGANP